MPECRHKGNIKTESFRNKSEGGIKAQLTQQSIHVRYVVSRSMELIKEMQGEREFLDQLNDY